MRSSLKEIFLNVVFIPWFSTLAAVDNSVCLLEVSLLHTLLAEELLLVGVRCLPALAALLHWVDHFVCLLVHHRVLGGAGRHLAAACRCLLFPLPTILPGLPAHILWSNANFGI